MSRSNEQNLFIRATRAHQWLVDAKNRHHMDWIEEIRQQAQAASTHWRNRDRAPKKICQWVVRATGGVGCRGIVVQKGTIYCPYHQELWEQKEMMQLPANPKPMVD